MIDTRKQFQLQTGVFSKRPDVVMSDRYMYIMLHAKFQDHRTISSGGDFKGFYHNLAW